MKIFPNKNRPAGLSAGFTIIETLVAISILIISITGPMVIVSQSLKSAYFARDQITAFYLAQEAIEYVRNLRDSNIFNGSTDRLNNLTSNGSSENNVCGLNPLGTNDYTCALNYTSSGYTLTQCSQTGGLCSPLNFDSTTGIFGNPTPSSTNLPSAFSRTIYVMNVPKIGADGNVDPSFATGYQVLIKVVITWSSSVGKSNTFVLDELVTNW